MPAAINHYRLCLIGRQRLTVFSIQASNEDDAIVKARQVVANFVNEADVRAEIHTPYDRIITLND